MNCKSSGRDSRSLATPQLLRRIVAILVLALVCVNAWGDDYVIKSGNYYLQVSGNNLSATNTFNPATCIWNNTGNTFNCNGKALGYSQTEPTWQNKNEEGTKPYNTLITLGGTSISFYSGVVSFTAYTTQTQVKNQGKSSATGTWYIDFSNGTITATTTSSTNNATAIAIAYNSVGSSTRYETKSVTVTISPLNESINSGATGTFTATATAKQGDLETPAHQTFVVDGTTYYKYNDQFYTSTSGFETLTGESDIPQATVNAGVTYTWSLTGAANPYLSPTSGTGATFTTTNSNATRIDYSSTLKVTATYGGKSGEASTNVTALYPRIDPTAMSSLTISSTPIYVGKTAQLSYTLTPENCHDQVTFTSSNEAIATVDADGLVRGIGVGSVTITATAHKMDNSTTEALTKSITVSVRNQVATPVINFTPTIDDGGETATASITCTTESATIYYTTDGTTPTSASTPYNGTFTVNNLDVVKAIAYPADATNWDASEIATATYSTHQVPTPTINITSAGVTFSCEEEGVTFYYTTDGTTPMTSSTQWDGNAFTPTSDECTIKVIAVKSGAQNSEVAERPYVIQSGISGDRVILNDYEDHNWTYYAGVDASVDGGHYNTTYLNKMYSPNPRNVKITYRGGGVEGASAVAISGATGEGQNEMVYYKTIEKTQVGENADYAYHVIPNPFSKRPKLSTQYYGFGGWKLVSGGEHVTEYSDGATLPLEPTIHFTDLDNGYSPNCTSAEIVFEATWVAANVVVSEEKPTFTEGTYETNFWVLSSNPGSAVTLDQNMTFTQVTPDGGATHDYRNDFTMEQAISFSHDDGVTPKIEFMKRNNNSGINPNGKNLYIGRGVTNQTTSSFYGSYGNGAVVNQVIRVESGNFGSAYHYRATPGSVTKHIFIWGCDYDRAKGVNTNLTIAEAKLSDNYSITNDESQYTALIYIKSGRVAPNGTDNDGGSNLYYVGMSSTSNSEKNGQGLRYMEIQGGELRNIAGASTDHKNSRETIAFRMRMKGGTIHGMAFGCARGNPSYGSRAFVLTGGKVKGWVTPGSNGNSATLTGYLFGRAYLYAGGNFRVDSEGSTTKKNRSVGGNLFGSGCGYDDTRTTGGCELGSNVVVADNAYVERGVYAGGSFGYSDETSYIYITGGHVAGVNGGISSDGETFNADIQGGVYGGSCQNKGKDANIYMTGGLVESGIYGGSNRKGTMSGYTNILITGGTVNGNVHGGGFGENTIVSGNVDVTIGTRDASTGATVGTAVINGDVYGGSALGKVNGTAATEAYHTNVTLNAGTIYGSLYGGGLGDGTTAANVYGPVAVKVYGGSVNTTTMDGSGAVYGCNNVFGAPQRSVTLTVCGGTITNNVYGGGNQAAATVNPVVTISGGTMTNVFGGGLGATATITGDPEVHLDGSTNAIQKIFGGGALAPVTGNPSVTTTAGTANYIFAGGQGASAVVTGNTSALINGGTINNDVYGGGEAANVSGSVSVTVSNGTITHDVYGGGALAHTNVTGDGSTPDATTTVNLNGGSIGNNVYGGALGNASTAAYVYGPITVNLGNNGTSSTTSSIINGSIFGCNNVNGTPKNSTTVNIYKTTPRVGQASDAYHVPNVYGGGNQADYTPDNANNHSTLVSVYGCYNSIQNLYGGGNAACTPANHLIVEGGTFDYVFGGGNGAGVGNPGANVGFHHYAEDDPAPHTSVQYGTGVAKTEIQGGVINHLFGGSNTKGNIRETALSMISEGSTCNLVIGEVYGGGNEAPLDGDIVLNLNCSKGFKELYGGAKAADINKNINLTITSGDFGRIFGGNNVSGTINGTITVNIEETGCYPIRIGELYGGGNQAAYSTPAGKQGPTINIISCTEIGKVFGGGYGEHATVTGDTYVNINMIKGAASKQEEPSTSVGTIGEVYGGGYGAPLVGNTHVNIGTKSQVTLQSLTTDKVKTVEGVHIGDVEMHLYGETFTGTGTIFGGGFGEDAILTGDTHVDIRGNNTRIDHNVYGGGNGAKVTGNTDIIIGDDPE